MKTRHIVHNKPDLNHTCNFVTIVSVLLDLGTIIEFLLLQPSLPGCTGPPPLLVNFDSVMIWEIYCHSQGTTTPGVDRGSENMEGTGYECS